MESRRNVVMVWRRDRGRRRRGDDRVIVRARDALVESLLDERARRLLRRGLSVKQVAAEVGYTSPGAFGRVFLQRVGTTPSGWQKAATRSAA
jgi:AraC-like DNA-binding protein